MFELSIEQRAAIVGGEPVPCVVNETQCVVVRKDVYDRLQHVAYDDSEWAPEEMIALAERAFADADATGPIE